MSARTHILFQRLRPGMWFPVLFLALAFSFLVRPGIMHQGKPVHYRLSAERISADEPETAGNKVIPDDHIIHRTLSVRAKAKIPSFFRRSTGGYNTADVLYVPGCLRASAVLLSTLLRPGNYLFLFRYTPF